MGSITMLICLKLIDLMSRILFKLYAVVIWSIASSGCRTGRFPPVVRTAVPVDGRFEHIVLSCNATSDHAIIWIERESQWALNVSYKFLSILAVLLPKQLYKPSNSQPLVL